MIRQVVIFGATGGIGMALVGEYANQGVEMHLVGRRKEALHEACRLAENKGASALSYLCDIRDHEKVQKLIENLCAYTIPQTWLFATGVSSSVCRRESRVYPENSHDLVREMEVNATGIMFCVNTVALCAMKKGNRDQHIQIGLISSLAALTGLASSPGYSASKAALMIYGEATRRLLAKENIGVTVVLPGFVTSDMSRRYLGSKPLEISSANAARIIRTAMEKNRAKVAFPWVLAVGIGLLNCLPEALQKHFLKPYDFSVEPDVESVKQSRGAAC